MNAIDRVVHCQSRNIYLENKLFLEGKLFGLSKNFREDYKGGNFLAAKRTEIYY